jgi:hypothetical protein
MATISAASAAASRLSGEWSEDDFDVLADGLVVGRIFKADAAPAGMPWMWTMLFDYRWPTHGYATSREAAMAAFAKSWLEGSTALGVSAGAVRRALRAPETAAMQKKKAPLSSRRRG